MINANALFICICQNRFVVSAASKKLTAGARLVADDLNVSRVASDAVVRIGNRLANVLQYFCTFRGGGRQILAISVSR